MKKIPELLAPAGDMERLQFALDYGADAVYLAGKSFGMRAGAGNFDEQGLTKALALVKTYGKRAFLTINAIPRDSDLNTLPDFLSFTQDLGIDALICADLGVFTLAGRYAPKIERHISTQAGILNTAAATAWHDLGAKRVILARELSLNEIAHLRAHTPKDLEIEVFCHGAMCVSFSGRCLLSQYMVGRDANQGNCAQPCRWKYHLVEATRPNATMEIIEDGGTHIMNARDLSMIGHLQDLIDTGVDSLKIEGRAKSFYYAAVISNAYRKALDALQSGQVVPAIWQNEVEKVSHRHYSTGFFYDENGGGEHYDDSSYIRGAQVVGVVEECDALGNALISQRNRFLVGDTLELLTPSDIPEQFQVTDMTNEKDEPISVAPHPMMLLKLKLPHAAPKRSILRKNI